MNGIFLCMVLGAVGYGIVSGRMDAIGLAVQESAAQALQTVWDMAGAVMLFCAVIQLLEEAGVTVWLERLLRRPVKWLFPDVGEDARKAVTLNLCSNMLGLGNAATPEGIRAMRLMAKGSAATHGMCLLMVINATSVQLVPATLIAMRTAAGSVHPDKIWLPCLLASLASTLGGVIGCKACERWGKGA